MTRETGRSGADDHRTRAGLEFRYRDDRHDPWGLIGHADGVATPGPRGAGYARQVRLEVIRFCFFGWNAGKRIGERCYRPCRRFGLDRSVPLIKRRAGRSCPIAAAPDGG